MPLHLPLSDNQNIRPIQEINPKANQKYSGNQGNNAGDSFVDELFAPVQSCGKREHPEKTAQQNRETGEKSG